MYIMTKESHPSNFLFLFFFWKKSCVRGEARGGSCPKPVCIEKDSEEDDEFNGASVYSIWGISFWGFSPLL